MKSKQKTIAYSESGFWNVLRHAEIELGMLGTDSIFTEQPIVRLGDQGATVLKVTVRGDVDLTDYNISFEARTTDKKIIIDSESERFLKTGLNTFEYKAVREVHSFVGATEVAYFVLEKDGERTSTQNFFMRGIEDAAQGAEGVQEHYVSVIDKIMEDIDEALEAAEKLRELIESGAVITKDGGTLTGDLEFEQLKGLTFLNAAKMPIYKLSTNENSDLELVELESPSKILTYKKEAAELDFEVQPTHKGKPLAIKEDIDKEITPRLNALEEEVKATSEKIQNELTQEIESVKEEVSKTNEAVAQTNESVKQLREDAKADVAASEEKVLKAVSQVDEKVKSTQQDVEALDTRTDGLESKDDAVYFRGKKIATTDNIPEGVDISGKLNKDGDTMTGSLEFDVEGGGKRIAGQLGKKPTSGILFEKNRFRGYDWENDRQVFEYLADSNVFNLNVPSNLALKSELPVIPDPPDLTPFVRKDELDKLVPKPDLTPFVRKDELDKLVPKPDLTPYMKKSNDTFTGLTRFGDSSQLMMSQSNDSQSASARGLHFIGKETDTETSAGGIGRFKGANNGEEYLYMGFDKTPWERDNGLSIWKDKITHAGSELAKKTDLVPYVKKDELGDLVPQPDLSAYVKKAGDTISGDLTMFRRSRNNQIHMKFGTVATEEFALGINDWGRFEFRDIVNSSSIFQYDKETQMLSFQNGRTNALLNIGGELKGQLNSNSNIIWDAKDRGIIFRGGTGNNKVSLKGVDNSLRMLQESNSSFEKPVVYEYNSSSNVHNFQNSTLQYKGNEVATKRDLPSVPDMSKVRMKNDNRFTDTIQIVGAKSLSFMNAQGGVTNYSLEQLSDERFRLKDGIRTMFMFDPAGRVLNFQVGKLQFGGKDILTASTASAMISEAKEELREDFEVAMSSQVFNGVAVTDPEKYHDDIYRESLRGLSGEIGLAHAAISDESSKVKHLNERVNELTEQLNEALKVISRVEALVPKPPEF